MSLIAKTNHIDLNGDVLKWLKDEPVATSTKHYYVIDCVRSWRMVRLYLNIWFNRSAGLGVASMCSGAGAIIAPIVLHFQMYFIPLPLIVFGSLSIVAGALALMLPETNGQTLPQTLNEVDSNDS
ncbi:hypothetical protein Btru_029235 [Bulinus truncatus]|nr:hypothetical protein Btru_029235 [Bulinus truncatus]